jgi:formylglycine-generating enzyme required for sulfatase activity
LSTQSHVAAAAPLEWVGFVGGVAPFGHRGAGFAFDNELPCHEARLQPFDLGSRLVSNGEYLRFVESSAYTDAQLWLAGGWDWVNQNRLEHPLYWHRDEGAYRLNDHPLDLRAKEFQRRLNPSQLALTIKYLML